MSKGSQLVVNWHMRMPPGLAYVMMSRSSCLEDLFIKGKFNEKRIRCDQNALNESLRLEEISLTNSMTEQDQPISSFTMAFLNIRSLKKHLEDVKLNDILRDCDTFFLTETWLDKNEEINLPPFYGYFGNFGAGKGICTFSKHPVKTRSYMCPSFQVMSAKHDNGLHLMCVYLSKDCSFQKVADVLSSFGLFDTNETCIFGDFNYDFGKKNALSCLLQENFINKVSKSTHDDGHILDHFYAHQSLHSQFQVTIHPLYHSDHDLILCQRRND